MSVKTLPEMRELLSWIGRMPRAKNQLNALNGSDCELIRLGKNQTLAVTVDSLSDEMEVGLYRDPFTVGWMTGAISLSDLSACGAEPLGLLISNTWGEGTGLEEKRRYADGLRALLKKNSVALLGGDSGTGRSSVHSSVALGLVKGRAVGRIGMKPGEILIHVGKIGIGPALGFRLLLGSKSDALSENDYRPAPRLREGRALARLATAMMDTSDGVLTTLFTLSRLNGVGFELEWSEEWIAPEAAAFCREEKLPLASLLFGEHGDYQLIATVKERDWPGVKKRLPQAVALGRVTKSANSFTLRERSGPKYSLPLSEVQGLPRTAIVDILKAFEFMLRELRQAGVP